MKIIFVPRQALQAEHKAMSHREEHVWQEGLDQLETALAGVKPGLVQLTPIA